MSPMPEIIRKWRERINMKLPADLHYTDGRIKADVAFAYVLALTKTMTPEEFDAMVIWSNERE